MALEIAKNANPLSIFHEWYELAQRSGERDVTEMALATATPTGICDVRIVLLKEYDQSGFCFFTNYESDKARALAANSHCALNFHWLKPFHRQIRIQGVAEKTTYEESNAYFQSRPRGSQVGAWASPQSRPVNSRQELEKLINEFNEQFKDQEISCPKHWGGYRIKPLRIEFWQEQEFRLHDRFVFERTSPNSPWQMQRLAP